MCYSPYRFEAAWHTFEFAYHVVEAQANLVVVTMAWSTREDAHMFSRTPEEPDMDTLTYWAQRLEPVIRAESKEEIIVVFCNRCGKEGKILYAGTSAVVGIKEGEVNVYGLLGRGVNDLLVVDTNVAPFAKLIHRPEGDGMDNTSHVLQGGTPKHSTDSQVSSKNIDAVLAEELANRVRKSTSTPSGMDKPKTQKPPSPTQVPKLTQKNLSSATRVNESPLASAPIAPSPTPSARKRHIKKPESDKSKVRREVLYPHNHATSDYPSSYGIDTWVDQQAAYAMSPSSGQISEKYFWLPPQPTFKSPKQANFPALPPVSPIVASSLLKLPGGNRKSMSHLPAPEVALSPELNGSLASSNIGSFSEQHGKSNVRNRHNTQDRDSPAPQRPESPKSRNASRTGRPLDRRPSEVEQSDLSGMLERWEALAIRPGSSMDSHNDIPESRQGRPRTPRSRPASRSRRPSATPHTHEANVRNVSHTRQPIAASSSIFSEATTQGKSDVLAVNTRTYDRKGREPGTIRPCPRAGVRSRNRSITGTDSGNSRYRSVSITQRIDDPTSHIEPDDTRTAVWSELSKLVGEVLERPKSRDVSRGRQRVLNRSASVEIPMALGATRSGSRDVYSAPRIDHRVASQDRHANTGSRQGRSIISSNMASESVQGLSNPYNPEDDIIAEIIFHNQGCPAHSHHRLTPSGSRSRSQVSNTASPPSFPRSVSRQNHGHNSRASQRQYTPQGSRKSSSQKPSIHRNRSQSDLGVVNAPREHTPLKERSHIGINDSCPAMDGASIHTITSGVGSPATPPLQIFEPTTPKAMKLAQGFGKFITPGSDPTIREHFVPSNYFGRNMLSTAPDRPRSAG